MAIVYTHTLHMLLVRGGCSFCLSTERLVPFNFAANKLRWAERWDTRMYVVGGVISPGEICTHFAYLANSRRRRRRRIVYICSTGWVGGKSCTECSSFRWWLYIYFSGSVICVKIKWRSTRPEKFRDLLMKKKSNPLKYAAELGFCDLANSASWPFGELTVTPT